MVRVDVSDLHVLESLGVVIVGAVLSGVLWLWAIVYERKGKKGLKMDTYMAAGIFLRFSTLSA